MILNRFRIISKTSNNHRRIHRIKIKTISFFIRQCKLHLRNHRPMIQLVCFFPFSLLFNEFFFCAGRQSSNSSRKYSQDETSTKNGSTKQSKKSRKAQLLSKVCCFSPLSLWSSWGTHLFVVSNSFLMKWKMRNIGLVVGRII